MEEDERALADCLRQRQQNHLSMQQNQPQYQQSLNNVQPTSSAVIDAPGMPPLTATINHHYQHLPPNCVPLQGTDSVSIVATSSDDCGAITAFGGSGFIERIISIY